MKKCLSLLTLTVLVLFCLHTPVSVFSAEPDTIKVNTVGENNTVTVNSRQLDESCINKVDAPVQGEITQTGENNRVQIRAHNKSQSPNNKQQITHNKCSRTVENKTETKPARQHITVTQTGINNSVKINSR